MGRTACIPGPPSALAGPHLEMHHRTLRHQGPILELEDLQKLKISKLNACLVPLPEVPLVCTGQHGGQSPVAVEMAFPRFM
jgi:hypothetical protein